MSNNKRNRLFLLVVGARPNFVKIAPITKAMEESSVDHLIVHTGQHYDRELNDIFFEELCIKAPDFDLEVGSGSHAKQTAAIMTKFEPLIHKLSPFATIVVGDVNSTVACALVSKKEGIPVIHVEAGLRCYEPFMPEEINRVVTDHLSDCLLAPSTDAMSNLEAEGLADRSYFVGNVMIDSLVYHLDKIKQRNMAQKLNLKPNEYALVTLHRASNVDDPFRLMELVNTLNRLSIDRAIVFPVHPRTRKNISEQQLSKNIKLLNPLGYVDFLSLVHDAQFVITDSGGVQEETTFMGVPCFTVRKTTERPITITCGSNQLIGENLDDLMGAIEELPATVPNYSIPELWDGHAAKRIVRILKAL